MAASPQLQYHDTSDPAGSENETERLLNQIRFEASACRVSAHLDIFEACAVLDPKASSNTVQVLLRVLRQALDNRPVFHRPGESSLSFDERWLLSLLRARHRNDFASTKFMIARRVPHPKRRIVATLIDSIHTHLETSAG